MLHRGGASAGANFRRQRFATLAVVAGDANFDQLVTDQGTFDFGHYPWGQACVCDHDHRFERMGARLERLAFGCGESIHGHGLYRAEGREARVAVFIAPAALIRP